MIVGGSVVKCPQIYNLVVAGNADGISLATQYMEMFMYGTPVAYNLSLGKWLRILSALIAVRACVLRDGGGETDV